MTPTTARSITLSELASTIAAARGDAILVTGPGAVAGELWATAPDSPSIYNMELAYATAMAVGLALAQPGREVIAVEGDGSMLAGIGALATIARYRPPNITVVVIDNGIFATGDNRVATQTGVGADLAAVAVGLGWPEDEVVRAGDVAAVRAALGAPRTGPRLIVAAVDPASYSRSPNRLKPGLDVAESAVLLRRQLQGRSPA